MLRLSVLSVFFALVLGVLGSASVSTAEAWGTQVNALYTCVNGKVTATLTWSGNSPYATGQWVEMSYFDNGWKPYTTTSVGPFGPKINTMSWDGLQPLTRHFLRFRQQYADGSGDTSLTFRFDTPWCGADGFTPTFLSLVPTFTATPGNVTPGAMATSLFTEPGDYDCAGGSGDGPNFIEGPVDVSGGDPHGLDADGDGIGCEESGEG